MAVPAGAGIALTPNSLDLLAIGGSAFVLVLVIAAVGLLAFPRFISAESKQGFTGRRGSIQQTPYDWRRSYRPRGRGERPRSLWHWSGGPWPGLTTGIMFFVFGFADDVLKSGQVPGQVLGTHEFP